MPPDPATPLLAPQALLSTFFEPAPALLQLLGTRPEQFFVIRVEDMYQHLRGPVPAIRSGGHTALFITSGEARMAVG